MSYVFHVKYVPAVPYWDTSDDDPSWDLTIDEISAVNDMMTAFEKSGREFTEQDLIDTVNARREFKKELRLHERYRREVRIASRASNQRRVHAATDERTMAMNIAHKYVRLVRDSAVGDRNDQLNRSAFQVGRVHAGGFIEQEDAIEALRAAAAHAGLQDNEIWPTLQSGFNAGFEQGWESE